MAEPIALLLTPRTVGNFILYDQGQDLLRAPGVHAVEAPRPPYGAVGRLPDALARPIARAQARRIRPAGDPVVAMIFHPFQEPLAAALADRHPGLRLWYGLFDRTPAAPDASPRDRARLEVLHARAAERAELVFAVSPTLVELEREAGREALLMPSAADSFPAPDPAATIVAVSFGNLGRRTDWKLLRALGERMPELVLLLVGGLAEDEVKGDPDFAACRELPNLVWLGRRPDDEAARLILCADVGLLPMPMDPFNDAGLPNRILKAARLGRRTVAPPFSGIEVWREALVTANGPDEWVAAVRGQAGKRTNPDLALREWALAQTGEHQDRELWRRLRELGVAVPDGVPG